MRNSCEVLKTIRVAGEADIPHIVALHQETTTHLASICPPEFGMAMRTALPLEKIASDFCAELSNENSILLICEIGGRFAGFALATVETFEDDMVEAPFQTIVYLETRPEFRNQGVARALVEKLENLAKERKLRALELTVLVDNIPAINLYESIGFKRLELRMAKPLI